MRYDRTNNTIYKKTKKKHALVTQSDARIKLCFRSVVEKKNIFSQRYHA